MKLWFQDNDTEMYSTHKEKKKADVAEKFMRTLQSKTYK